MSNSVVALVVAIVGVVGTLTAAVLTQLFAMAGAARPAP